jgi:glutathione S-transferase
MITLYHCSDARSFRVLWLLEELGLEYRLEIMTFPPRRTAPDYLVRNPLGTVPLMIDGDEVLFDSAAILLYLSSRGDGRLALRPDEPGYGEWLSWVSYGEADLTMPLAAALRYGMFRPEDKQLPDVVADQVGLFLERAGRAADRLETADYLSAGRFTAADISVGYALMLSHVLRAHKQWPASFEAYWSRLKERPAFLAAKAAQQPPTA